MSLELTYRKHTFPDADRLWLQTVASERPFDPRATKARLYGKLPKDFDPPTIDSRFYRDNRLTLLGIRVFRPEDPIFSAIEAMLNCIREMILANPKIDGIAIQELAGHTRQTESLIRHAVTFLGALGSFFSGHTTNPAGEAEYLWLTGPTGFDAVLSFESIDALLQQWYEANDPKKHPIFTFSSAIEPEPKTTSTIERQRSVKRNTAFVIMPIDPSKPELEDVLVAIKEVCGAFEVKAYRADEIEHQDRITNVILDEIRDCDVLIADLTHERPNVYYEVGYAHALNKKPILYRRQGTRLHFDLSVHNVPEYRNITELRELLRRRLEAILGRSPSAT